MTFEYLRHDTDDDDDETAIPSREDEIATAYDVLPAMLIQEALTTEQLGLIMGEGCFCLAMIAPTAEWTDPIYRSISSISSWDYRHIKSAPSRSRTTSDDGVSRLVVRTLAGGGRVLGVAPDIAFLPGPLQMAADLTVRVSRPTVSQIASVIETLTGTHPGALDADVAMLSFEELVACLRAGSSAAECVDRLSRAASATTTSNPILKDAPELAQLTGYGEAMDWAAQLVDDLGQWRRNALPFRDIHASVILASEPGLGKNTLVRAIARTAALPLISTSVAEWFATSNGHLDGVIKRLDDVFERARALAPCLIYLDEIDSLPSSRPLELVLIDHTRLDVWAVVEDQYGRVVMTERPWLTLAIDVYSRMILGAVMTFEPPSVYSAMLCLRQIVRAKEFLTEKYGHHKGATDGWGKPTTIVMDNAWEFSGISMQSICEAAGIHVIWAPVGTPTFKAIVERFFRTLNEMVWHRLGSGIPFKPQVMQELGLDPRAKALFRIDYLSARMWDGIVNIYHVEPHSDLNMAPAERWTMGLRAKTRPTIDDVGALDKMLGNVSRCVLSAEGVSVNGQRFHEPTATSALLDNLLRFGAKRSRRKGFGSSGTVAVIATWDRVDASYVHVWDVSNNTSVRLPNVDKHVHGIPGVDGAPSQGLSWAVVDAIKAFASERNMAFHSPQEKAAARHAYYHEMPESVAAMPFNVARHYAAELERSPNLIDGDTVVQHTVPATPKGAAPETPREFSASHRTGEWAPPKAPSRGRTPRASRSKGRSAPPTSSVRSKSDAQPIPTDLSTQILDSAAALDALADDL